MAATALILFDQFAFGPGNPGEAYTGTVAGGLVTVTNVNNTDVVSWTITLLDVPPDSALVPGILGSAVNNTPTASFTPDVPGSYRILLEVSDGSAVDKDIRNFGIRTMRGFLVPPYQKLPDPLPVLGSGLPGEKPDEQNYDGQTRGWTGNRADGQLEEFFHTYDDLKTSTVITTPFTPNNDPIPVYVVNLTAIGGSAVFNLPPSGTRFGQQFRIHAFGGVAGNTLTINPPGGHTINGLSSVVVLPSGSATIVRGPLATTWYMIGAKRDKYERTLVAATESTDQTGFVTIGSTIITPADYPNTSSVVWEAILETTSGADAAEIRLFNVTTATQVAGSVLSTTSLTPVLVTSSISLAAGANLYEAQIRLMTTGFPNRATCKQAQIIINWLQP